MSRNDDRDTGIRQRSDSLPEIAPRPRVRAGGRFIEKQNLRFVHQPARHAEALFVTARQFPGWQVDVFFKLEILYRPFDALFPVCAAQPVGSGEKVQVFTGGEIAVEREFLGDITELSSRFCTGCMQIDSGDFQ